MVMKLVVGLGNPGRAYANSRHNVGFHCVNAFARAYGILLDQRKSKSRVGLGKVGSVKTILAKPRTFMNLSGQAVGALLRRFDIALADLLVIYDDLDLPLGTIRLRERGSAGGHNGMKSIIAHLKSQDFLRLRVGIAPLEPQAGTTKTPDYVLGDFTRREREVMRETYARAVEAIYCVLTEGIVAAMNKYN